MTVPPNIFDDNKVAGCGLQGASSPLFCDSFHHYYHYQSSVQYLWLAKSLHILGRYGDAAQAYRSAIFQDHLNPEALQGKTQAEAGIACIIAPPLYDKHPAFDAEFCRLSGQPPEETTSLHDDAVRHYTQGHYTHALTLIPPDSPHSNSRFLIGRCYFHLGQYETATAHFAEAIRISHGFHDQYHRYASGQHLERGTIFLREGNTELAIADFTKALDLHRGNAEALRARATAYRAKGSERLAEEDERRIV